MRSGISEPPEAVIDRIFNGVLVDPHHHWTPREYLATAKATAAAPPGGDWVYTNSNFALLGLAIEAITGRTLAQVERDELFTPAGLSRIAAQDTEKPTPPIALPSRTYHLTTPDGYLPCRAAASYAGAVGGIAADAPTLARWGYVLYGARLLKPASVAAMITPPPSLSRKALDYGLATQVFGSITSNPSVGHTGSTIGYSSFLLVDPTRHLSIAVLAVQQDAALDQVVQDLLGALA